MKIPWAHSEECWFPGRWPGSHIQRNALPMAYPWQHLCSLLGKLADTTLPGPSALLCPSHHQMSLSNYRHSLRDYHFPVTGLSPSLG